jgi:hypothetical protein
MLHLWDRDTIEREDEAGSDDDEWVPVLRVQGDRSSSRRSRASRDSLVLDAGDDHTVVVRERIRMGDFKGDPAQWMRKYFDAFLHITNWGTRELKLRIPAKLLPPKAVKPYLCEALSADATLDVMEWLRKHPRVTFHFTPTSASWLNQVEGFFSILTRRSLRQTSFDDRGSLKRHIAAFLARWNEDPTPFVWTKSAHRIVRDHRKMVARISRAEH